MKLVTELECIGRHDGRGAVKMKGLCKEDNGAGRWESEAFGGYLCSPSTKKYIPCYRQNKPPTCIHTNVNANETGY